MHDDFFSHSSGFDVQSLTLLRTEVRQSPQQGIVDVAHEVESTFLQMMLKSMRDTVPQDGLTDNDQTKLYNSLYDQQIAQNIAQKGIGLADMLIQQWEHIHHDQHTSPVTAIQTPLSSIAATNSTASTINQQPSITDFAQSSKPNVSKPIPLTNRAMRFLAHLSSSVQQIATETGVNRYLIMAQAALESGWGSKEISLPNGQPSHNLFGIKADKHWQGSTTKVQTTEYLHGIEQKISAKFKVYDSYKAGLRDYMNLLAHNSRYRQVVKAKNPISIAYALQQAGYSTDPHYAEKLVKIIQQISGIDKQFQQLYHNSSQ